MSELAPWQTAWPAGVVLLGLVLGALWSVRQRQAVGPRVWLARCFVFGLALVVRLVVLPALSAHVYDGHEAEYWDIFRGVRDLGRGGTVLYPSMQWLWWGLGRVLPHAPWVPVVLMAGVGAAGAVLVGMAAREVGGARAAVVAGVLVALHPIHAAWSSSAYNVVLPSTLMVLSLWTILRSCGQHRLHPGPILLGASAAGLAVLTRLETVLLVPIHVLVLVLWTPDGISGRRALRRLGPVAVVALPVVAVTLAGVWPLVFPGEVPGAGERALSFCINKLWLAPFWPWDGVEMLAVAAAAVLAVRVRPAVGGPLLLGVVVVHLTMASFDDYADRHALMVLPWLAVLVGLAVQGRWGRWGTGLAAGLVVVELWGLGDLRTRYYGDEDVFVASLAADPALADLPRVDAQSARVDGERTCAWINEDHRAMQTPPLSHFNLVDPLEVRRLQDEHGCIRWCADVQDWRWSSRGVRDRALRTHALFRTHPVAVVMEQASGYGCLVLQVDERLCCGAAPPG